MTEQELIKQLHNVRSEGVQELCWEAADHIEQLVKDKREAALSELAALGQAAEAYDAQRAAEAKLAKAVEALEGISAILFSAMQGDNEHGVRALNEASSKNYLKDFPLTLAALSEVQNVIEVTLADLEEK